MCLSEKSLAGFFFPDVLEELPTGLVEIPSLSEGSFHWLVEGNYTMEEARKALPSYFHDFLETNLKTEPEFLHWKVVNADIEKFLKGKPGLTHEDILQCLPKEFRHHVEHFLLKNTEELPPH